MTPAGAPSGAQEPQAIVDLLAQKRAEQSQILARARRRRFGAASFEGSTAAPSPWPHVPLLALFEDFGYTVIKASATTYETAHAAHPVSKSGRNMVIWPGEGRALCRKCNRVYDAPAFVMEQHGVSFEAAVDWLIARYGPPKGWRACTSKSGVHGRRQAGHRGVPLARGARCAGGGSERTKAFLFPQEMPR
jgi:hypothetical protein